MASILNKVPKIIAKALKPVFYDAVLERDAAPTGNVSDPTFAAATRYTCKAIAIAYTTDARGLNLIAGTDVNILILANTLSITPRALDRITIPYQNITGSIVPQGSPGIPGVQTDPATATWQCRAQT